MNTLFLHLSNIDDFAEFALPDHSSSGVALIEPEIAVVLGKDLPPRETPYDEKEVQASIAEARLVLELIGSRYVDPNSLPFPEFLADSINNQGFLIGPPVISPFERHLETLTITVSGKAGILITHEGRHPNGHPLRPLVWLANFSSPRGEALKAGTIVTTGSYAGILEVPLETPSIRDLWRSRKAGRQFPRCWGVLMDAKFHPAIVAIKTCDIDRLRVLIAGDTTLATSRSSTSHPTLLQCLFFPPKTVRTNLKWRRSSSTQARILMVRLARVQVVTTWKSPNCFWIPELALMAPAAGLLWKKLCSGITVA